jgi:GTP cyclohydrolase II
MINNLEVAKVQEMVTAKLPSKYGDFNLSAFSFSDTSEPALVLTIGPIQNSTNLLVRIHSSCITGDIFGSERCDCGDQLKIAMECIANNECGLIIYLSQEGRGIGIIHKLKAYNLQEQGFDTVEANLALGLPIDSREYSAAIAILNHYNVRSIRLISNNPEKYNYLVEHGIVVNELVHLPVESNINNLKYLTTKREKMGHFFHEEAE